MTSLLLLPDDIWHELSRHLPLPSLFALLQTNSRIHSRLLSLLPSLTRSLSPTPFAQRTSITTAILRNDIPLATFLLRAPGVPSIPPDHSHPLLISFRDPHLANSLNLSLARALIRDYLRGGGLPSALIRYAPTCTSLPVVTAVAELAGRGPSPDFSAFVLQLALAGRTSLVLELLTAFPDIRAATSVKLGCRLCMRQHTFLHAAAEVGDVELAAVLTSGVQGGASATFLNQTDCDGESALGIAIRKRNSRVAQLLVQAGAVVNGLVVCGFRDKGDMPSYLKPAVDVD